MYCPMCSTEYREGFTKCPDCGIDLVKDKPPEQEPELLDLATVFAGDSGSAAVISATLNNAGIESWIKNEGILGVFPNLGPAEIVVGAEDETSALRIIEASYS